MALAYTTDLENVCICIPIRPRHAFGDYIGFQVAWGYWVQTWIGNAAIIVTIMAYLASVWPELLSNKILAICICINTGYGNSCYFDLSLYKSRF